MSITIQEVNKKVDEVCTLVQDFQDRHKGIIEKGNETSEGLETIKAEFATKSEEIQAMTQALEAEEKARKEMELALARIAATGGSGAAAVLSNEAYRKDFFTYMSERKAVAPENQEMEFQNALKYYGLQNVTEAKKMELKTLMVGSNPAGGYLVPVELLTEFSKRLFETSPMRSIARVRNTSRERIVLPLKDGLFTSVKKGELDTSEETDTSEIAEIEIPVSKQQAEPIVTQDMLDDAAFNVEAEVMTDLQQIFSLTENTEFVNGSGTKEAQGFLTLPAWANNEQYERYALADVETATANAIDGDDLINLQAKLIEPYRMNNGATWTMNRLIWAEVLKLKDENGQYLLNPAMLFSGALGMQLLGDKVVLFADMPSTLADNAYAIAYGNFQQGYTIVDRIGMRMIRDEITSKGYVKYYTTKRTGGKVTNFQAIKRLKVKAAA
jgi:HK97 family phage major capsid protein